MAGGDVIGKGRRVLFFGRFQPFHRGHLAAVNWLLERYDEVVVLVGMADESHTWRNPFTAGERLLMIREALRRAGVDLGRIITATIQTLTVYSGNAGFVLGYVPPVDAVATANPAVNRAFRDAGVKAIAPPLVNRHVWCGEYIRCLMLRGDESWRRLVPEPVPDIIDSIDGVSRLQDIVRDNLYSVEAACSRLAQQR
ncbi:nicotinamide-nucleotide adenylyltransferase [Pyrodictium occultum]|uniref:Nicotinamide-nucleotide adenylyltransferase n=1 Tax=Pyrodictium occultum TaxID=2309 RepID=A0A0V8RW63_PYROC|nr:nicotinamide-nucleotide adenylyltransferase [Pyrodictium occultum]KSW12273.1 nicotinamide-nucleotide adenylyltransferase [Pyrodictium occultum]